MSAFARPRRTPSPTALTSSSRAKRPIQTVRIWRRLRSRTSSAISALSFRSTCAGDAGVSVVVTGYASLDYAVRLDRAAAPGRDRDDSLAPARMAAPGRLAGLCRLRLSVAAACATRSRSAGWRRRRRRALPRRSWRASEFERTGSPRVPDERRSAFSPISPTAAAIAFTIRASPSRSTLDEAQRGLVAAAEWVCLTVGPAAATRSALAAVQPDAKLVWAVKADARAVPADLAAAIAARADIVAFSRGEAEFVAKARASTDAKRSQILIETRGREGVALSQGSARRCLSRRCARG